MKQKKKQYTRIFSKLDSLAAAAGSTTAATSTTAAIAGLLIVGRKMAAFEWDCDCGWSEWDLDSTEWTAASSSPASSSSKRPAPPPPPPPFFDLPPPPLPPSLQPPPELCSSAADHPLGLETCQAFLVIVQTNGFLLSLPVERGCFLFGFFNLFSFHYTWRPGVCVCVCVGWVTPL